MILEGREGGRKEGASRGGGDDGGGGEGGRCVRHLGGRRSEVLLPKGKRRKKQEVGGKLGKKFCTEREEGERERGGGERGWISTWKRRFPRRGGTDILLLSSLLWQDRVRDTDFC